MPLNPRRFFLLEPERKRLFHLDLRSPHFFQPSGSLVDVDVKHGEAGEVQDSKIKSLVSWS